MYSILSQNDKSTYGVVQYVINENAELSSLPTNVEPGSAALSVKEGDIFILNNNKEWVKMD